MVKRMEMVFATSFLKIHPIEPKRLRRVSTLRVSVLEAGATTDRLQPKRTKLGSRPRCSTCICVTFGGDIDIEVICCDERVSKGTSYTALAMRAFYSERLGYLISDTV